MRLWTTEIRAIDPRTGELKTWGGPHVPGINKVDAENFCQNNGLGYCEVTGELVSEIPTKDDGLTPDWGRKVDYLHINSN